MQSFKQPTNQPIDLSTNTSYIRIHRQTDQKLGDQSIDQSTNQSLNQFYIFLMHIDCLFMKYIHKHDQIVQNQ